MTDKDEDPGRLIYDWTDHLRPPTWVKENAYNKCKHCQSAFKSGKSHHCRLCGEMYCSACTGKYHVPVNFHGLKKHKTGPVRVCNTCKDGCLKEKKKSEDAKKGYNAQFTEEDKTIYIAPPEWQEEKDFQQCPKCSKKKGSKTHNCRACGKLYCDGCTSKMQLPPYFEKKAHKKPGTPMRVCDECRFKIVAGAKLVEKVPEGKVKVKAGEGLKKLEEEEAKDKPADGIAVKIKLEKEGEKASTLCEVHVKGNDSDLKEVDKLMRADQGKVEFKYTYMFRELPIPREWWDVFTIKILGRTISMQEEVKKKQEVAPVLVPMMMMPQAAEPAPVVDDKDNPFKRKSAIEVGSGEKNKSDKKDSGSSDSSDKNSSSRSSFKAPVASAFKAPVASGFKPPAAGGSGFKPPGGKPPGGGPPPGLGGPPPGLGGKPSGSPEPEEEEDEEAARKRRKEEKRKKREAEEAAAAAEEAAAAAKAEEAADPFKARAKAFM